MSIWHLDLNMKGYEVQLKVITTAAKSLARWTKKNILHKGDDFLPFLLVILIYLYNKSQHIILYQCFVLTDLHTVLHGNVLIDLHTVLDGNVLNDLHTVLDRNVLIDLHTVLDRNVLTDLHTVLDGNVLTDLHTVLDGNVITD